MHPLIKKHYVKIGTLGGKAKTPAKSAAARANGNAGGFTGKKGLHHWRGGFRCVLCGAQKSSRNQKMPKCPGSRGRKGEK